MQEFITDVNLREKMISGMRSLVMARFTQLFMILAQHPIYILKFIPKAVGHLIQNVVPFRSYMKMIVILF